MATGYTRTISTAELDETPRVALEQALGDIQVEGWDRPEIEIAISDEDQLFDLEQVESQILIRPRPRTRNVQEMWAPAVEGLKDLELGLEKVAGRLERKLQRRMRHMHLDLGKGFSINFGQYSSGQDYKIKVPHNCNITMRTSTGDISIKDVNGTIFVKTTSGDIRMGKVSGVILAQCASGDLHFNGVQGKLGAHSASGDVTVLNAELDDVSVHSSSGDVEIDLRKLPEGEWGVRSVSGDVDVTLPGDAKLTAEVKTLSGDVHCSLPHERIRLGTARGKQLVINGGGPTVRMETVSGDVNIRPNTRTARDGESSERDEDRERDSEVYSARSEAELEILKQVENGDLSPQEAMQRLSQLGR